MVYFVVVHIYYAKVDNTFYKDNFIFKCWVGELCKKVTSKSCSFYCKKIYKRYNLNIDTK